MNSLGDLLPDFRFFYEILSRFLKRNSLFQNGSEDFQAFVGVSGGADSLCLLYTLSLFPAIRNTLTILHFNHQTDPDRNELEEAFVRDQAINLGLPIMTGCRKQTLSALSEDTLRRERYQFFDRCLEGSPRPVLFLGHHRSDQSETILMNIFRNRGPRGLLGMSEFRDGRYARPFLSLTSSEIRTALQKRNLPYLKDPSNQDSRYLRNRVRNELAPLIREIFPPMGIESLSFLAEQMDKEFRPEIRNIDSLLDHEIPGSIMMPLSLFRFLSPVRQSILVEHLFQQQLQWSLPIAPSGNILRSLNKTPPLTGPMGNGWFLSIESGKIRLTHISTGSELDETLSPFFQFRPLDTKSNMEENIKLPRGGWIHLALEPIEDDWNLWERGMKPSRQCVIQEKDFQGLALGYPFRGAKITIGFSGNRSKNLNREILKSRLSRQERPKIPVLYQNGEALWVPGVVPLPQSPSLQSGWGLKLTYFPWKEL
ncbi:MAG: tRNA lysidine(34) synthetase TilS [Leptospirillum sp.]|jgi:tRNA(Ile)-lysidine synthase